MAKKWLEPLSARVCELVRVDKLSKHLQLRRRRALRHDPVAVAEGAADPSTAVSAESQGRGRGNDGQLAP